MRKLLLALTLAALCLGAGSCGDDDPVKPAGFAVTVKVTDPAGNPVEGLRVGMVNDTPYYQDGLQAEKAAGGIQFELPMPVGVRITIEDVEGREIRVLVFEEELPAGRHRVIWNGLDDQGVHQPSGRYTAHLVATQLGTGLWVFEDRTDMMLAMLDWSRVPAGYTDANGRLVLTDKKLFPHLYDLPDMTATSEDGEIMGKIQLTPLMRIGLSDTVSHQGMNFKKEVLEGSVLEFVWNPHQPRSLPDIGPEPAPEPAAAVNQIPPPEFRLDLVFPNPFN